MFGAAGLVGLGARYNLLGNKLTGRVSSTFTEESWFNTMQFSPDGLNLYLSAFSNPVIYRYALSIAWDVTTASYASDFLDCSGTISSIGGFHFNKLGTNMLFQSRFSTSERFVLQWTFATPWTDLTNGVYAGGKTPDVVEVMHQAVWRGDGTQIYQASADSNNVYTYDVSTPYDATTMDPAYVNAELVGNVPRWMAFSANGRHFYRFSTAANYRHYVLSTPWDLSTKNLEASVSITAGKAGFAVMPNGGNLFVLDSPSDGVVKEVRLS